MKLRKQGSLSVTVMGMPRPQGSVTPFRSKSTGKLHVKYNGTLVEWRGLVTDAALKAIARKDHEMFDEMVTLQADFYFKRPKATPKWKRDLVYKWNGADLDKLMRAIGDALGDAGVYRDDSQIQHAKIGKWYTDDAEHVEIKVRGYQLDRI